MAKFLKGNELNAELERIFESAETNIVLISPYIKLHDRFKASLLTKLKNDKVKITVLFGKNEDDMSKSMKQEDFDFFRQFPNIEILFEKRLHAKYYTNEDKGVLTSMNLYGFSQNNNIEAGILMRKTLKGSLTGANNLDSESWEYFETVLEQAELLFLKKPKYERKGLLGFKKYDKSETEIDKLSDFFENKSYKKVFKKHSKKEVIKKTDEIEDGIGYCIRTGEKIDFNIQKPLKYEAFKDWNKYKDSEYSENYCHFSGESSNGKTSVNKPILNKNWKKAKSKYDF